MRIGRSSRPHQAARDEPGGDSRAHDRAPVERLAEALPVVLMEMRQEPADRDGQMARCVNS